MNESINKMRTGRPKTSLIKKCSNCDKYITVFNFESNVNRYCSRECYIQSRIGKEGVRKGQKATLETKLKMRMSHDPNNNPPVLKGDKHWNWKGGTKSTQYSYKSISKYPEKYIARKITNKAVKNGDIKKGSCMICGSTKTEAHHKNYNNPLDVVWLCSLHHSHEHTNGNAKLTEINVKDIRNMILKGEKQRIIAKLFNISESVISSIKYGRSYNRSNYY